MRSKRAVVTLLTIVLALTTALTLVGTAVTLADTPAAADSSADDLAVVRRFYAAVNTAIATGDLSGLDAVVAPDFAIGNPERGSAGDLEAFRAHLLALHAARPDLWIRIEEAIAGGDQVVTRLAFDGLLDEFGSSMGPLSVPEPGSPAWAAGDRVRLASGRIVALDGITLAIGAPRAALDQLVEAPALGQSWLGLARVTIAPFAEITAPATQGFATYAVESGTVDLDVTGVASATGVARRLEAGDEVTIPAGASVSMRNPSPLPVVLLTAAMTLPTAPWPPRFAAPAAAPPAMPPTEVAVQFGIAPAATTPTRPANGELVQTVSLGGAAIVPGRIGLSGQVRLTLARLAPSDGRNVLPLTGDGPALLAVETGQALVTATGGASDMVAPEATVVTSSQTRGRAPTVVLAAGQAALTEPGATVGFQSAGDQPLTLLVLTLAPA